MKRKAKMEKKANKKINLRGVKSKLIIIMGGLVAVPLIAAVILSSVNTINEGINTSIELNDVQSNFVKYRISSVMEQNIKVLKALAQSPSTIEFLTSGDKALEEKVFLQLKAIDEELADGNSTIVTNSSGIQKLRTVGKCLDVSEREYFKQTIKGQEYVSDIQISKSTGERMTTFAVPIFDYDSKIIGIVQRNYNLNDFYQIIEKEAKESRQEIVIVDNTGSVVAHSEHEIKADSPEDQSGNLFFTDSRGSKIVGNYEVKWEGDTWFVSWQKESRSGWVIASCRVKSVALSHVNKMILLLLIFGMIFLIIGIIIAIVVANSFMGPIRAVNQSLMSLAEGSFLKINNVKLSNRKDEFGTIVKSTDTVIEKLNNIVSTIKTGAKNVRDVSEKFAETSQQISQTANDVSNAVQEIATGATEQANDIQNAVENTNSIGGAVEKVQESTENLTRLVSRMQNVSKTSEKNLTDLQESGQKMNNEIEKISTQIAATGAAVDRINDKVDAITDIAGKTNLLALNASIEAARAGESGKGFAVVATEISKLADDSKTTADEIRIEMKQLLDQSQCTVDLSKEVQNSNLEQQKVLEPTVKNVQTMIEDIDVTVEAVTTISNNSENCATSKDVVVNSMESLSAISEENAASSEETEAAMHQLTSTVTTLANNANSLKQIAENLEQQISFFNN